MSQKTCCTRWCNVRHFRVTSLLTLYCASVVLASAAAEAVLLGSHRGNTYLPPPSTVESAAVHSQMLLTDRVAFLEEFARVGLRVAGAVVSATGAESGGGLLSLQQSHISERLSTQQRRRLQDQQAMLTSQQSLSPALPVPPPQPASTLLSSKVPRVGGPRPWYDIRGLEKLPNCVASARHGSRLIDLVSPAAATVPCLPAKMLQPGDYLLVANRSEVSFGIEGSAAQAAAAARRDRDARRLVRILPANAATKHPLQLLLGHPWEQSDASNLAVFRVLLSADAIIGRVRHEGDLLRRVREGELKGALVDEGEEKAKARARSEEEEKAKARARGAEEEEKAKAKAHSAANVSQVRNFTCEGGIWLPGEVAVVGGSPVVTTSRDLRNEIPIGGRIWISNRTFVVTEPRDAITLTLSSPWPESLGSSSGLHACRLLADNLTLDCAELSGCLSLIEDSFLARTSTDLTNEIVPGEVVRILWANGSAPGATQRDIMGAWENVTNSMFLRESQGRGELFEATVTYPQDPQTLTLSGPWRGPTVSCVKACKPTHIYSVLSGGLIPLCGTVAVEHGSHIVHTTCDLRNVLNGGDWLRIGTETTLVTSPFTADKLTITTQYNGPSAAGIKAFKQSRDVPLSGTISVTAGSPTLTTSSDLRAEVAPGDLIRIFQAPGRTDLFEVVLPQDMYSLTIAVPHPGPSAHGLKAYKVTGTEQMLSGTLEVVHGSTVLATSMDLTGEIGVGDGVRIGNVDMTVANILPPRIEGGSQSSVVQGAPGSREKKAGELITNRPWPGVSARGLRAFKLGKSAEQEQLEKLAAEKLRCTTIYCLAKIEERERALPFSVPRLLAGGDNVSSGGSPALSADILFLNDTSSPIAQDYVPASSAGGSDARGATGGRSATSPADSAQKSAQTSAKDNSDPRVHPRDGPSVKPEHGGKTGKYFNDWTQKKRDDFKLGPPPK